jgi:hypothetical protein
VVESLGAAISFFSELGLELEGRTMIDGEWSGRVTGLHGQRADIATRRNTGRPRQDRTVALCHAGAGREHRNELVDEVGQYENVYRLCYVRGPEGILVGLAEKIG